STSGLESDWLICSSLINVDSISATMREQTRSNLVFYRRFYRSENMEDQTQPVTTVTGERVALGPIRRDHLLLYQQWMNQLETTRFLRMGVYSFENEEDWYEKMARAETLEYLTIYSYPD